MQGDRQRLGRYRTVDEEEAGTRFGFIISLRGIDFLTSESFVLMITGFGGGTACESVCIGIVTGRPCGFGCPYLGVQGMKMKRSLTTTPAEQIPFCAYHS
jgi:hypothetical protein